MSRWDSHNVHHKIHSVYYKIHTMSAILHRGSENIQVKFLRPGHGGLAMAVDLVQLYERAQPAGVYFHLYFKFLNNTYI